MHFFADSCIYMRERAVPFQKIYPFIFTEHIGDTHCNYIIVFLSVFPYQRSFTTVVEKKTLSVKYFTD